MPLMALLRLMIEETKAAEYNEWHGLEMRRKGYKGDPTDKWNGHNTVDVMYKIIQKMMRYLTPVP